MKSAQTELLRKQPKAYGGELFKTRKGRSQPRPLDTRNTMHLVLRSSKAKGNWSLKRHASKIKQIVAKFSQKHGVKVVSLANVGNHLHFQIKLSNRYTYNPFIRAITSAIAMTVTGQSRWNKVEMGSFWDYRPFTRVVQGFKDFLNLRDYIKINQLEGFGYSRFQAKFILTRKESLTWEFS